MSLDPLTAAFEVGKLAIEKIWPDETKRAEQLFKLDKLRQEGDLEHLNSQVKLLLGQIEVNKAEASTSVEGGADIVYLRKLAGIS